jgi:hypothetical protein
MSYRVADLRPRVAEPSRWRTHERIYGGVLRRLGRWIDFHVFLVFRRELTPPGTVTTVPKGYSFRALTPDDLLAAARDPALQLTRERVLLAHRQGDLFFGIFHRGRLVAYRWYALSGATPIEDNLVIHYAHEGRGYGYRAFTHPDHRGRRLHLCATRLSDLELRARGCTHTVGYIAAENFASLRAHSRLAESRRIGVIVALRVGKYRLILRSPGVARHGVKVTE